MGSALGRKGGVADARRGKGVHAADAGRKRGVLHVHRLREHHGERRAERVPCDSSSEPSTPTSKPLCSNRLAAQVHHADKTHNAGMVA